MGRVVFAASRRALAVLALLVAVLLAAWVALFKVWYQVGIGDFASPRRVPHSACAVYSATPCFSVRPGWTIPVAIVIGLIGVLVAVLLQRLRSGPAERRATL
jgi:hypothetical protein